MFHKRKKQDKQTIIDRLKRFANGENLAQELLPVDLNKFSTEQLKAMLYERRTGNEPITDFVFQPPSWSDGEVIVWDETKTYPDPEISDVSYSNPRNVPVITPDNAENLKDELELNSISLEAKETNRLLQHKEYLAAKLKEYADQEKIDLAIREKAIIWNAINRTLW